MVFRLGDDDAIDQDAWNFDVTRIERTGCRNAFDLGDNKPLAVLGGRSEANCRGSVPPFPSRCCRCGQPSFPRIIATLIGNAL